MKHEITYKKLFFVVVFLVFFVAVFNNIINYIKKEKENNKIKEISAQVNICDEHYKQNRYKEALGCYESLFEKYENKTALKKARIYYAASLAQIGKLQEAGDIFQSISEDENEDKKIKEYAAEISEQINKEIAERKQAKRLDVGHYYTDLGRTLRWKNPRNIKVYIKGNNPKNEIIKQAFKAWDDALYSLINFSYVENEKEANIVASFATYQEIASQMSQDTVGVTFFRTYSKTNYFHSAIIKISKTNPENINHTDKELLAITLHEIGHALGIASHSPRKGDIMYPNTKSYKMEDASISNRDVNTIKRIYGNI